MGDYIGDLTPHANFAISTLKGVGLHMHEIVIVRVYFLLLRYFLPSCAPAQVAPFDVFSWFMAQKTCFRVIYVLFGVRTKFFLYFLLFFAKVVKITMVKIGKAFK